MNKSEPQEVVGLGPHRPRRAYEQVRAAGGRGAGAHRPRRAY